MTDTSGMVSLAGAVISAGAAVTTVVLTRQAAVRDRQAEAELALRYREPLLHAAFNLQTGLYNIASPTHVFLQHALLKLINLLDSNGDRVSAQLRQPL